MKPIVHVGCCGWSYLTERAFAGRIKQKYSSKLQAYAQLFNTVEINSTFYRLPRLSTAQKWRNETDAVNPKFEFAVKAFQGITHFHRFSGKSQVLFHQTKEICLPLNAHIILFQSPASFLPTNASRKALVTFFKSIDRNDLTCVWEPRGKWYDDPQQIADVCDRCNLVHVVDPFRNEPLAFGNTKIAYFRLHGFGKPSMYQYNFSRNELHRLLTIVHSLPRSLRHVYIFFNNVFCYQNALEFMPLLQV